MELTPKHPFYSANDFFRQQLGGKVVKLALDAGFTCPNRDGTLSTKGCIFCSGQGSGDFAGDRSLSVLEQIDTMKGKMSQKWGYNNLYMAYFQAFTNTYGPVDRLRQLYGPVAERPDISAISVATRPDCINEEVCRLFKELSQKAFICVELGLQTASDQTGQLINRCYTTEAYLQAVKLLKAYDINVITHIILGLPGESRQQMLDSVSLAVKAGTDGLKLQLLHILKGTALYSLYKAEPFPLFTYEEYINFIVDIVEALPPHICLHRITGDGNRQSLAAPRWSLDKRRVLNGISKAFISRNTYQGKYYNSNI